MAVARREQFISDALASDTDYCLIWPFAVRKSSGYGAYDFQRKSKDAHRFVCELAHGKPDDGEQASHRCGNKLCVNPKHLYWADAKTNMADAKRHGTLRGGGRGRQRFYPEQIQDICLSRLSLLELAAIYHTDVSYISRLRRRHAAAAG